MKDDVISRQAAIRWVKTECNPYGKPSLEYESGKKVIEYLKTMPSAQPEIVRCGECAIRDKWGCPWWKDEARPDDWYCADGERREE